MVKRFSSHKQTCFLYDSNIIGKRQIRNVNNIYTKLVVHNWINDHHRRHNNAIIAPSMPVCIMDICLVYIEYVLYMCQQQPLYHHPIQDYIIFAPRHPIIYHQRVCFSIYCSSNGWSPIITPGTTAGFDTHC